MQTITNVPRMPGKGKRKRVAAYARVSTGKDAMLHSLSAQVSYYADLIERTPGWEFAGVYSDEGITGTKSDRRGFEALLSAAGKGTVDMIVTKSISRFARNTVDLLRTVRTLASMGVDVFFEEQGMHSTSGEGELMLTILASVAQEESRSASENIKWRIRKDFREGRPTYQRPIGYRLENMEFKVVPQEAGTVRSIFSMCLSGMGVLSIAKELNRTGSRTVKSNPWSANAVSLVLRNPIYTGDLMLQKTFRMDHLCKRKTKNRGELPSYLVEGDHEPIVARADFDAAQRAIAERAGRSARKGDNRARYPYSGLVECGICGAKYHRRSSKGKRHWICTTYDRMGKSACPSRQIPEGALADAVPDLEGVKKIVALPGQTLRVEFLDGRAEERPWTAPSRRDSWTEEMKERARVCGAKARRKKNGQER